jgi:hypothetical protein
VAIDAPEVDGATLTATGAKAPEIKSTCDQRSPDGREEPHRRVPDNMDIPRCDDQLGFAFGLHPLGAFDARSRLTPSDVPVRAWAALSVGHLNLLFAVGLDGLSRLKPFSRFCGVP